MLIDILRAKGIAVQKGHGAEIRVCCPFCTDRGESEDTRFRLGINQSTGAGQCFNCSWASRTQAPKWLLIKLGTRSADHDDLGYQYEEPQEESKKEDLPVALPEGFELLSSYDKEDYWARRAYRYIRRRGVTRRQLRKHLIGFTMQGRFAYRIVFPVLVDGNLVMLVCRDFTGQAKAKYLNSIGDKYIFGLPPKPEGRQVILSEGILKALKLERLSPIASASVLGHNITDTQLQQLKDGKYKTVILWPDPDKPGVEGVTEMAAMLVDNGFRVKTIWPLPKRQADEMSDDRVRHYLDECVVPYSWGVEHRMRAKACSL